jgi:ferredoxin
VLGRNGIPVVTSCGQGVCGTCLTGVLEGACDHRDAFLSDKERAAGDRILVCVSRAQGGRLVLDL